MRALTKLSHAKKEAEIDSEGTWAISYGDMVTLLLCFFILFFSIDKNKEEKGQMRAAMVQIFEAESREASARAPANEQNGPSGQTQSSQDGTNSGGLSSADSGETGIDAEHPGSAAIAEKLKESLGPVVHEVDEKLLIEYPGVSFFDSAKINLTEEGTEALKRFATKYIPFAGTHTLGIRAFTDTQKVKANLTTIRFKDNLELSALRSIATMRILEEAGIPMDRMRLGGYGELKITAQELTAELERHEKVDEAFKQKRALDLARKVVLVIEPGIEPRQVK